MSGELRRAAEAIKALGPEKAWSEANMLANHYLSAPDELMEAREIIEQMLDGNWLAPQRAREFLQRTGDTGAN